MYSTSRKITLPLANPSRTVLATASRPSTAPCAAVTSDAEQSLPLFATGADDVRDIDRVVLDDLRLFDFVAFRVCAEAADVNR
jgi:hypothetical protein